MSAATPPTLLSALDAEAGAGSASRRQETAALARLFEIFTSERRLVRRFRYLDDPKLRGAYLRYHVPLNFARAAHVLEHVRALYPAVAQLRDVVDIGAGPGSAALASVFALPDPATLRLRLHDRSRTALAIASRLLERVWPTVTAGTPAGNAGPLDLRCCLTTLPSLPRMERPSLIWFAMVLNELGVGARGGVDAGEFAAHLSRRVPPGSVAIIVEPALRAPARALLYLHDALCDGGGWRILAPCTHQRRCPLLAARGRSWCHFRFTWTAPEEVREIARPLGLATDTVSLAFLALVRADSPPARDRAAATAPAGRVIGDPMRIQSGRQGVYVCAEGERRVLALGATRVTRGDVIHMRHARRGDVTDVVARWEPGTRPEAPAPDGPES